MLNILSDRTVSAVAVSVRTMPLDDLATTFLDLHHGASPLLMPNPWDAGSARILKWLGFTALATTSSGFALTLGRNDGAVSCEEALNHAADVVAATGLPVSADLENGFAGDLTGVAETYAAAVEVGLAGASIEDYSGEALYGIDEAAERVAAAVEAAAGRLVITARAENHIRDNPDLADTITRLQRYQEAGAHVLFAPGVTAAGDLRTLLAEVDRPVNVLLLPGGASVAELGALGVNRISVGGAFAYAALTGLVEAGRDLLAGNTGYLDQMAVGRAAAAAALGS
jgi:2-methylisocitrate lyase-like PEP mutase family enzyme